MLQRIKRAWVLAVTPVVGRFVAAHAVLGADGKGNRNVTYELLLYFTDIHIVGAGDGVVLLIQ